MPGQGVPHFFTKMGSNSFLLPCFQHPSEHILHHCLFEAVFEIVTHSANTHQSECQSKKSVPKQAKQYAKALLEEVNRDREEQFSPMKNTRF